jgi:hypothetical protein
MPTKTFILRPTRFISGGPINPPIVAPWATWFFDDISIPGTTIVDAIIEETSLYALMASATPLLAFDNALRFDFFGNSCYLDGSLIPISFDTLPAGFTPLTAEVKVEVDLTNNANFYLQQNELAQGTINSKTFPYSLIPTALSLFNNGCGFRAVLDSSAGSSAIFYIYNLRIEGTYTIQASQFTLENSNIPVKTGDKAKVSTYIAAGSAGISGQTQQGILNGVAQIQLSYIDPITGDTEYIYLDSNSYYIILQEYNILWFYIPFGFNLSFRTRGGNVNISLIGNGVQFSGTVLLGTLQVLAEDASGIYSLVSGQTSDELYFREGYTTNIQRIMLPDIIEDTIYRDDFFSLMTYPVKILSRNNFDEDETGDFSIIASLQVVTILRDVEIPSPFATTAFLP